MIIHGTNIVIYTLWGDIFISLRFEIQFPFFKDSYGPESNELHFINYTQYSVVHTV